MRHVTHICLYSQVEPGTRKTSLQISYARIVISCHVCARPGVCSRVGSTPSTGHQRPVRPAGARLLRGGRRISHLGWFSLRYLYPPLPGTGFRTCSVMSPGLPWRTRETAFSSFLCRKTGGPLPRRPWHYRKSKARDREAVLPDTSNWRIIVPDITSSAGKTHAKLNGTAFRAVWRSLPVASCICAQAAGLHARRGSTAVSG